MTLAAKCLLVLLVTFFDTVAVAGSIISDPRCESDVCVINIFSNAVKAPPCKESSVLVAYSEISGATLIQCSKFNYPEGNHVVIYDRTGSDSIHYQLEGGKFIRPEMVATAVEEGFQDKFGIVPLCNRRLGNLPKAELVVAEKEVSTTRDTPFCYRLYFINSGRGLSVTTDDGRSISPIKATSARRWTAIERALLPYLQQVKK